MRKRSMKARRRVTIVLPADLLSRAQPTTGEGVAATVRKGLELAAASRVYEELRQLRG